MCVASSIGCYFFRSMRRATATPRPGQPVRGSRSGRPIMAVLDLLGRRWALRVLWELRSERATFRELQARCDEISPTVLNARLKDLRETAIVELTSDGYGLTPSGAELLRALAPLERWARGWEDRPPRGRRASR
jgi:DNA-binding HxlR family transcriptional regulator